MEKIKINMMSGSSIEKPLVTAFRSTTGDYVVLDNEINGTMGLPIILVTKLVNNRFTLIPDSEWNSVKEILRLIISGNQVDYINVSEMIGADDAFFKQLTLPVASFDALKNNYRPSAIETVSSVSSNSVAPEVMKPKVETSNVGMNNFDNQVSSHPEHVTPVMPAAPVQNQTVSQVDTSYISNVAPSPVVEPIPENVQSVPVDFTADKEAFLKACENMFDALVAKFNNK